MNEIELRNSLNIYSSFYECCVSVMNPKKETMSDTELSFISGRNRETKKKKKEAFLPLSKVPNKVDRFSCLKTRSPKASNWHARAGPLKMNPENGGFFPTRQQKKSLLSKALRSNCVRFGSMEYTKQEYKWPKIHAFDECYQREKSINYSGPNAFYSSFPFIKQMPPQFFNAKSNREKNSHAKNSLFSFFRQRQFQRRLHSLLYIRRRIKKGRERKRPLEGILPERLG